MESAADIAAAVAAVRAVSPRFLTASDDELLADLAAVETLGRMVDGLRVAAAAQVEFRSRNGLGSESLAFRSGARDAVQLVQVTAKVPHAVARSRVGIGSALAPATSLLGDALPGRFPVLAAAIAAGEVGVESARVIVDAILSIQKRVSLDERRKLERDLTGTAAMTDTDGVREAATLWALALDPDGAEPRERAQRRKRALRIGQTLADGTTRLTMILTPEDLALITELLQSRRRGGCLTRTTPGGTPDSDGPIDPEWRESDGPGGDAPRSRAQQDYDTGISVLRAGANAEHDGPAATAVTHTTVVTITAAELEARAGQGWGFGILAGIPVPMIERQACTGDVRLQVTGPKSKPLFLSRAHRVFSKAQKLALLTSAGGRCQYPGCRTPAPFLDAHHIDWYHRDTGQTHIDNGVMLCSYHHHLIHAPDTLVEIRRHDHDLYFVPTGHIGAPEEHHRGQTGPPLDPRLRTPA